MGVVSGLAPARTAIRCRTTARTGAPGRLKWRALLALLVGVRILPIETSMTDHVPDPKVLDHVLELLTQNGLPSMAHALETLFNEAMKIERSEFLRAAPYERSAERVDRATSFCKSSA